MIAALTACGADDEPPSERAGPGTTRPELTVPGEEALSEDGPTRTGRTAPSTSSAPPTREPAPPAAPAPTGAPSPTTTPSPRRPTTTVPDSPERDEPPPPGSPAERFETFCDENPEDC